MVEDKSPHALEVNSLSLEIQRYSSQTYTVICVLGSGQKSSDLIRCVWQHVDRFNRLC